MALNKQLADLDDLILLCRDKETRSFLTEAIASYHAGAYRAAIVSTWIAVVFDFIAKLRELALSGNGEAKNQLKRLERAQQEKDQKEAVRLAQDFERDVLTLAKEKFELLSQIEYDDLERLYEDRHRCAHPSMHSIEEPYQPSAELARLHIRNAVYILLHHPPVQGKSAETRIWDDIHSDYFPTDVEKAIERLTHGPLIRARASVIRSVIRGLTTSLLKEQRSSFERERQFAALNAVLRMHHQQGEPILCTELPKLVSSVSDQEWPQVISYIRSVPLAWEAIRRTRKR